MYDRKCGGPLHSLRYSVGWSFTQLHPGGRNPGQSASVGGRGAPQKTSAALVVSRGTPVLSPSASGNARVAVFLSEESCRSASWPAAKQHYCPTGCQVSSSQSDGAGDRDYVATRSGIGRLSLLCCVARRERDGSSAAQQARVAELLAGLSSLRETKVDADAGPRHAVKPTPQALLRRLARALRGKKVQSPRRQAAKEQLEQAAGGTVLAGPRRLVPLRSRNVPAQALQETKTAVHIEGRRAVPAAPLTVSRRTSQCAHAVPARGFFSE